MLGNIPLPFWFKTFSQAQGLQRQGLRAMKAALGQILGFQSLGGFGGCQSVLGRSLLIRICFSILVSEQQQPTSPTRVKQQQREMMLPIAVHSFISWGSVTSAQNFFCRPTFTPVFGFTNSYRSLSFTFTFPSYDTFVTLLVSRTQNQSMENCPFALSMNPLILKGSPYLTQFLSTSRWKMPDVLVPMHCQHSDVAVPYYERQESSRRGSRTLRGTLQAWIFPFSVSACRQIPSTKLMLLRGEICAVAGSVEGRSIVKGKEQCPRLSPPSNLLNTNSSEQVLRELRKVVTIFSERWYQYTSSVPLRLMKSEEQEVSSRTSKCAVPSRYCPAQMTGDASSVQSLTLLSLF